MQAILQQLVDDFLAENLESWDTARRAFCSCDTASYAFIDFCRTRGQGRLVAPYTFEFGDATNPDTGTYCPGIHPELDLHKASWHCIVGAEDCFIDWTARQYDSARPYPYIIPKEQALAAKA